MRSTGKLRGRRMPAIKCSSASRRSVVLSGNARAVIIDAPYPKTGFFPFKKIFCVPPPPPPQKKKPPPVFVFCVRPLLLFPLWRLAVAFFFFLKKLLPIPEISHQKSFMQQSLCRVLNKSSPCTFTAVPVGGQVLNQSNRRALPQVIQLSSFSGKNSASASRCPR